MDEQKKLAYEVLKSVTNQFITLATGILALGIAFSKDILKTIPEEYAWMALGASLFMALSIVFGMWTNLAVIGTLDQNPPDQLSVYQKNMMMPAFVQIVSFLLGLAFSIGFAVWSFNAT